MTPESIALWQEIARPLLAALREQIAMDQLEKLRDEARRSPETPPAVLEVIETLYLLRAQVVKL